MSQKKLWINDLRALATVSVVLLHVSGGVFSEHTSPESSVWWIGNIIDGMVRFCVPLFFMLSGVLLLSKDYSLGEFLKKRFLRIFPPFIAWSIIYLVYNGLYKNTLASETTVGVIKTAARYLLNGSAYHLWFVYTLVGLYLFVPILRKWIKQATQKELQYFLGLWFIALLLELPLIKNIVPVNQLINFSGYVGYMVLGYYLSTYSTILEKRNLPLFLFVTGTAITIAGTYLLSDRDSDLNFAFYEFLAPNVLLSSIGVFLFVKKLSIKRPKVIDTIINLISTHSFGVYLIHILILSVFNMFGINWKMFHPVIGIPVTAILCLVLSLMIIDILKRIPILRYIAG
ncbi:MAG: acyltransferase family protein [Fibrobacterales bacterium]